MEKPLKENILEPAELWDAAEEQMEVWREDKVQKGRLKWRQLNSNF